MAMVRPIKIPRKSTFNPPEMMPTIELGEDEDEIKDS